MTPTAPDVIVAIAPYQEIVAREGAAPTSRPGGAALYAALGAWLAGAHAALAGRWPEDAFPELRAAIEYRLDLSRLQLVAGSPGQIRLDLDRDGGLLRATSAPGLDSLVTPDEIPIEWIRSRAIIVPSLGHPSVQLAFMRKIRANTEIPVIAALFEPGAITRMPKETIPIIRECDIAFLDLADLYRLADGEDAFAWIGRNARWAVVNLGEPGVLLVTAGPRSIHRIAGPRTIETPSETAAIAGAVVASLALGRPIESAIRYGARAGALARAANGHAAGGFAAGGPDELLDAEIILSPDRTGSAAGDADIAPTPPLPVVPDFAVIRRAARALAETSFEPFRFDRPDGMFPPISHPRAAEFFFTVVLHQFGFWHLEDERWSGSMYGIVDGVRLKGSDFVWRSATKALLRSDVELTAFEGDDGASPLPMLESHRDLAQRFKEFLEKNPPEEILAKANASASPLETLLEILADAPGYAEDPYRKKVMLLAMTLANRPERFLRPAEGKTLSGWGPVVDYHIQRTSLRAGLVLPINHEIREALIARHAMNVTSENLVRRATFDAMEELSRLSGLSHATIDWLFFQARTRCPEVGAPDCPACPLRDACARQIGLFQPVFRTTAY